MGAHKETVKTLMLNPVFFYTETDLLGLLILVEQGKPLNVVDKTRLRQTSASMSPLKAITVVYIFLYRRSR